MKIEEFIKSGETSDQFLGAEIEHFILDENNRSVYYSYEDKKSGVQDILEELSPFYDERITENYNGKQYLIGLRREDSDITIEPGAQFEISIKKCSTVNEIENIYNKFLDESSEILKKHNYHLAHVGYRPDACALEVPIIPKMRYVCMDANFKNVGTQGFCMMRCSAATQLTIDYSSEEDCKKKMKVATALSPVFYFLLDNSPIFERCKVGQNKISPSGIPVAKRMARWQIWDNADPDRCTSVPEIFSKDFSYKKYTEVINNLPEVYTPHGLKTDEDKIKHELSMAFYDVRLKNKIEIRPADSMPKEYTLAYFELLQNLFYNSEVLDTLWEKFKDVSFKDYKQAGVELQNKGWEAQVYGQNIHELLKYLMELVQDKKYIEPIDNLVNSKTCLREKLEYDFKETPGDFRPISNTSSYTQIQVDEYPNCKDDFNIHIERRKNSRVAYLNKISETGYFSKVYDVSNQIQFRMLVSKTSNILRKVYYEYWNNPSYKDLFKWDKFAEPLVNFKPKYNIDFPVARFDIFFNNATGQFEFCEFNTGGSAAMSKVTFACEEIKDTLPYKKLLKSNLDFYMEDVYTPWVKQFEKIYYEWANNTQHNTGNNINIGMIDLLDNCQLPDFGPFKEVFEANGINCEICDIRDLSFDGENLTGKEGISFDAIYKRITLDDMEVFKDNAGVKAFIEAVMSEKVCPIDWFNSQIVHDKQLFAILHMHETLELLSESEKNFVKLHIPETYILNKNAASMKKLRKNKDDYLIKPISSRDSRNVFIGFDMDQKSWADTIEKCANDGGYIIQAFAKMQYSPNVIVDINEPEGAYEKGIQQCCNMEGLYCYNSKFNGMYLRQRLSEHDASDFNMAVPVFYEKYEN